MRDTDNDGVAESVDHFMSIQVDGAEATGMIFNPVNPTQYVVSVQHPDSTNIAGGNGDALWVFDISDIVPPSCEKGERYNRHSYSKGRYISTCSSTDDFNYIKKLSHTVKNQHHSKKNNR